MDASMQYALRFLPRINQPTAPCPSGLLRVSGTLDGSRVSMQLPPDSTDGAACPFCLFGDFLPVPWGPIATGTAHFKLYVDGALVASSQATYDIVHQ
jgi:hypothetical protein